MALKLTKELMKDSLYRHLMEGETIEAMVYGQKINYLITLLSKYYFLALTNKRLLVMRVNPFFKEKELTAVNLEDIKGFNSKSNLNGKNVTIEGNEGRIFQGIIPSTILGLSNHKEDLQMFLNRLQELNIYAV